MRQQKPQPLTSGMSLLEMMVVLGIMALVAGLVAPRAISYMGRAKSQTATIQMQQIRSALQLLYIDIGRYPTEAEGLELLISPSNLASGWRGPYLDDTSSLNDPWGRNYIYRSPGAEKAFEIESLGRDGQPGGSDDDADISV